MAYIGRDIEYGSFTKQTLTADSSTVAFALDQSVLDAKSLLVSVGGVIQEPDVAYTASGTTLTFTGTPVSGDPIWIVYLGKTLGLSSARGSVTYQTATGDGSATTVAMTSTGTTGTIIVTLNGVMQTPSTDFSVSGTTLTFTTAPFSAAAIGIYYIGKKAKLAVPAAASIQVVDLAAGGTLPAWNGSALTGVVSIMKSDILEMQNNIALLNFLRSNDSTTKRLSMLNGFNDMFRNTTGVDGEGVNINMTHFDGANYYLTANSAHNPGFSNGKSFLVNFWVRAHEDDKLGYFFGEYNGPHPNYNKKFNIYRDADNKINVVLGNTSNVTFAHVKSTRTLTVADGATMITVAINMAAASATDRIQIRIGTNAVETLIVTTSPTDTIVGLGTGTTGMILASDQPGTGRIIMDLGRFYLAEQYLDISVAANFAKLITTSGYPVDIGTDGSAVTGTAPKLFLNSAGKDSYNNSGTGGTGTTSNNFYNWGLSGVSQEFRVPHDGGYTHNEIYSSNSFTNSYEILQSFAGVTNQALSIGGGITDNSSGHCIRVPASGYSVSGVEFYIRRQGALASGTVYAKIHTIASGSVASSNAVPSETFVATSTGVDVTTLNPTAGNFEFTKFTFPHSVQLSANTDYFIGLNFLGGSGGLYIAVGTITGNAAYAGNAAKRTNGGTWSASTHDMPFALYGRKNVNLITKGTDSLSEVSSPASAPTKGHLEVIMEDSFSNMQSQELPSTTAYGVGYDAAHNRIAQGFKLPINGTIPSVELYGKTTGATAPDSMKIRIETDSGGNPSGTLAHASGVINSIVLQNSNAYQTVTFDSPLSLSANTQYWLVVTANGTTNSSKHFVWGGTTEKSYDKGGWRKGTSSAWSTVNTVVSFLFRVNVDERTYTTINTDIIGEISRDGGTTYSPAVLSRIPKVINGSSYDILAGDVDFTGDPSGTNLVGRIRTVNKHKVTVNGIAVNWI